MSMKTAVFLFVLFLLNIPACSFGEANGGRISRLASEAVARLAKGDASGAKDLYSEFDKGFRESRSKAQYDKAVHLKAAECYLAFGASEQAADVLYEMAEKSGRLPPEYFQALISSLFRLELYSLVTYVGKGAGAQLRGAEDRNSLHAIRLMQADAHIALGQYEDGIECLRSAIRVAPSPEQEEAAKRKLEKTEQIGAESAVQPLDPTEAILRFEKEPHCGIYLKNALLSEMARLETSAERKKR